MFLLSGLLPKLTTAKIVSISWPDHDPILLMLSNLIVKMARPNWCLNESLLSNESYCLDITTHLKSYLEINKAENTTPATNWAAQKALVRGFLIQLTSQLKMARDNLLSLKSREYETLAAQHKRCPDPDLLAEIEQIRTRNLMSVSLPKRKNCYVG